MTFELTSFLVDVMGVSAVNAAFEGSVTYHDSCSGLRELASRRSRAPSCRAWTGVTMKEMADSDVCCGFGGTFCVKYGEISNTIVSKKTANIRASGAGTCSRATSAACSTWRAN